jgi:outer membrane protein assembly factor BamA
MAAIKTQFGSINGYGGKYAPVDQMFNIGGKNPSRI